MLFNSIEFLIFFPLVTLLFFLLKHKYRWILLLIASCVFYMFFIPQYILILFVTILIDYVAAIYIEKSDQSRKKKYLIISIVATCLVLIIFKYLDFFNQNMIQLSHLLGFYYPEKVIKVVLPIGLSFHTFQSLSYVIEVYRGHQKAERNFGIYSLYVMFYPQLVTGPIERPQNLLVQLKEEKKLDYSNLSNGLRLILYGLFVKMVIADNLASYVDQIYANPKEYGTLSILTGLFFYSFQIYCDFLGYSTIAVGCAKSMGYNLMDNFKNPYFSKGIGEFWQRWHISLSSWFRDYVYFSLGGNKVKIQRWMINILIVFALSGFWHGANWTFIIWGLAHGFIYIMESLSDRYLPRIKELKNSWVNLLYITKTFILVSFIWILFRASSIYQVKTLLASLLKNIHLQDKFYVDPKVWIFLGIFILSDYVLFNTRFDKWCSVQKSYARWSVYFILIFMIIVFSSINNFPFIYFQF
ncbi:MAG: MBOAT family protein [Saprospiraceae bacterium]|nr:MBOAT family protein [Saprospiraceae bacterium]